jgi:hypothetical protein
VIRQMREVKYTANHPLRNLELRRNGYGVSGGYERPYKGRVKEKVDDQKGSYGPIPHAGYYGGDIQHQRFRLGQASFEDELSWYKKQFGEETSGPHLLARIICLAFSGSVVYCTLLSTFHC